MPANPVWTSWSGLTTARPRHALHPADPTDVVEAVVAAAAQQLRVKMVGSGHSFTDIAAVDGLLLHPDRLTGVCAVDTRDPSAMSVTALAGTPLHELNRTLQGLGLALANLGDIDRQTVAGAISTGTHGTGGRVASLSAQVVGADLVVGDGTLVRARLDGTTEEQRLLGAVRVGLGALGVITAVTFRVVPAFHLEAVEAPMRFDEVVDGFDDLVADNEHFEAYWFPHTDGMLTKRNNPASGAPQPLSRTRGLLEDELLANTAFGLATLLGARLPGTVPTLNRLAARTVSHRRFSDVSHRVLTSSRRVRFREMEYALPRDVGMQALTEVRALVEQRDWRIGFPVEIRTSVADDCWLSPAHERDTVWLAFHVPAHVSHEDYFGAVEQLLTSYGGRPHWGKLHTRSADDLATAYPAFSRFLAVRDEVDPDRRFANPYLERVLGR